MEEFNKILRSYCNGNPVAIDLVEEEKYRGCRIWTFKRVIKKYRMKNNCPTYHKLVREKSFPISWKDIPEGEKEKYTSEFFMALTNFDLEFEDDARIYLSGTTREEARYRLEYEIDKQYSEQNLLTNIM